MTQSRIRDLRICYCPIHKTEFIRSCPECLEKIREDMAALKRIPYRSKARRYGKPRRVSI